MSFIKELAIAIPIIVVLALIGAHLVVVPTGSMSPAINEGDMVIVEKTDVFGLMGEFNPKDVKQGDVIIYSKSHSSEEEFVIHRVAEINESSGKKQFRMKGDNNTLYDEEMVSPDQVTGRVLTWNNGSLKIPQVGWLVLWFKH
jgi:signal peptidase